MTATVAGIHLGLDIHANRPAANTAPDGSFYSCSTHSLIYKSNFAGNSWATWATLGGTGLSDPMTTRGDIIVRNSSNTTARLAAGTAGKFLTSDGTDVAYGQGPLTTTGDLMIGATGGTPTRLAAGATSGHVLTSNGSGAAPSWQAAGGGGGGADANHPLPLDSVAIDGTYGDDFAASSLDAAWTRRNFTSGAETYQVGGKSSYIRILTASRSAGDGYYRTAPAGDWTFAMKFTMLTTSMANHWGLMVVDTNGTGVGFAIYHSAPTGPLMQGVTTYTTTSGTYYEPVYGSTGSPNQSFLTAEMIRYRSLWLSLRKSSTNYYAAFSLDGDAYSPEGGPLAWAGTVDRVAMGLVALSSTSVATAEAIQVDWFNKIA